MLVFLYIVILSDVVKFIYQLGKPNQPTEESENYIIESSSVSVTYSQCFDFKHYLQLHNNCILLRYCSFDNSNRIKKLVEEFTNCSKNVQLKQCFSPTFHDGIQ